MLKDRQTLRVFPYHDGHIVFILEEVTGLGRFAQKRTFRPRTNQDPTVQARELTDIIALMNLQLSGDLATVEAFGGRRRLERGEKSGD